MCKHAYSLHSLILNRNRSQRTLRWVHESWSRFDRPALPALHCLHFRSYSYTSCYWLLADEELLTSCYLSPKMRVQRHVQRHRHRRSAVSAQRCRPRGLAETAQRRRCLHCHITPPDTTHVYHLYVLPVLAMSAWVGPTRQLGSEKGPPPLAFVAGRRPVGPGEV